MREQGSGVPTPSEGSRQEQLPRLSVTGIPRWVLLVVPFVLVALVVGTGFIIAGATSVDGGPGFATPSPRAPSFGTTPP
jgi:hypothetical protein